MHGLQIEVHRICSISEGECLHEYSVASVIWASAGYSAFPVSLEVSQIESLDAFKDGTHLVYCVHGVFTETLYGSFIFPSFLSAAGRNNILVLFTF